MARASKPTIKFVNKLIAPRTTRSGATTKKDGSPLDDWSEMALTRMREQEQRVAAGGPLNAAGEGRICVAWTTGKHGSKRPCTRFAIEGSDKCYVHCGGMKYVRKKAREMLMEEVFPTIRRIREIRDQDEHMPSALGAGVHMLNRALGKPDATEKDKGTGAFTVNVGLAFGGLPPQLKPTEVTVAKALPSPSDDDDIVDAELDDEDDE